MKKYLIIAILIFSGCTGKLYFNFQIDPFSKNSFSQIKEYIAIEEMEIPNYLKQDHIAVMREGKITFLSQRWIEPLSLILKKDLISFFMKEKSLGVVEYPWQKEIKTKAVIKIVIEDFIYENKKVVLKGYYLLKKEDKTYKKLFSYQKKCTKNPDKIVKTMQKLYKKLLQDIRNNL